MFRNEFRAQKLIEGLQLIVVSELVAFVLVSLSSRFLFLLFPLVIFSFFFPYLKPQKFPFRVQEARITLDIQDNEGNRAHYIKRRRLQILQNGIEEYKERFEADGKIENICVDNGDIRKQELVLKELFVDVSFHHMPKRFEIVEQTISMDFIDSFAQKDEYWRQRIEEHTERIIIEIKFPEERPYKTYRTYKHLGRTIAEFADGAREAREDGRNVLVWQIEYPELMHDYLITWTW